MCVQYRPIKRKKADSDSNAPELALIELIVGPKLRNKRSTLILLNILLSKSASSLKCLYLFANASVACWFKQTHTSAMFARSLIFKCRKTCRKWWFSATRICDLESWFDATNNELDALKNTRVTINYFSSVENWERKKNTHALYFWRIAIFALI